MVTKKESMIREFVVEFVCHKKPQKERIMDKQNYTLREFEI